MQSQQRVKVSSRYQIAVPKRVRDQLKIKQGDHLLVEVRGSVVILLPEPHDYVSHMAGLHKDVWQGVDTADYIRQERDEWTDSPTS